MKKLSSSPAITHSEKGNGFHEFFKEQTEKIQFSHSRVKMVESNPPIDLSEYSRNYDSICWKTPKLTKMI
jgi:hypothetical protein